MGAQSCALGSAVDHAPLWWLGHWRLLGGFVSWIPASKGAGRGRVWGEGAGFSWPLGDAKAELWHGTGVFQVASGCRAWNLAQGRFEFCPEATAGEP